MSIIFAHLLTCNLRSIGINKGANSTPRTFDILFICSIKHNKRYPTIIHVVSIFPILCLMFNFPMSSIEQYHNLIQEQVIFHSYTSIPLKVSTSNSFANKTQSTASQQISRFHIVNRLSWQFKITMRCRFIYVNEYYHT